MTQDAPPSQKANVSRKRDALQSWAVDSLPRLLTEGYRLALGDQEPREIRQWSELLARLGQVVDKEADRQSGLAVFQFNFQSGGVAATPMPGEPVQQAPAVIDVVATLSAQRDQKLRENKLHPLDAVSEPPPVTADEFADMLGLGEDAAGGLDDA